MRPGLLRQRARLHMQGDATHIAIAAHLFVAQGLVMAWFLLPELAAWVVL